ncbi:MAG: hypothetical protein JO103_11790 [Candidatus Eremiobacteraeota bacterium]|nr:hypothetical protein [Candidatus Eremiobacteraeota bacterium]MBV9408790.1 hypothetical protein [Candidatus Eremiobacteraeota bacterium]
MPNLEAVIKLNPSEGGIDVTLEDLERRIHLTPQDAPYYCGSNSGGG